MDYHNTEYWKDIHSRYKDQLKAVGHPSLSECLNQLKYESESSTIEFLIENVGFKFKRAGQSIVSLLDVGAGTGFWTNLVQKVLGKQGIKVEMTAIDLSIEALESLRKRNPGVKIICADLKTIDPDRFLGGFDLVVSCYCLHHLIHLDDFLNALRFAGRSVREGGALLIMDPVLTLPYSQFDVIDFNSYAGNGIPRHLYLLDDILGGEGLLRETVKPAVSFLINGSIESYDPVTYAVLRNLWKGLSVIYRFEAVVRLMAGVLREIDRVLKSTHLAFSSSVCVYKRSAERVSTESFGRESGG